MIFYVQVTNNKVTDIITYPYGDYIQAYLDTPLPQAALSGAYELLISDDLIEGAPKGKLVYHEEWDTTLNSPTSDSNIWDEIATALKNGVNSI